MILKYWLNCTHKTLLVQTYEVSVLHSSYHRAWVWPPGGTLLVLSTGAAGEEESVTDDCLGGVTGREGESVAKGDDIAGLNAVKASSSLATTAFLISGISPAPFVTSLFSGMLILSSLFLPWARISCFLSVAGSVLILSVSVLVAAWDAGRLCPIVSPVTGHTDGDGSDLRALLLGSAVDGTGGVLLGCSAWSVAGCGWSPNRSAQAPPGGCFLYVRLLLLCVVREDAYLL